MTLLQSRLLAVVDFLLEAQEQIARTRVKYLSPCKIIARKESIYLHDMRSPRVTAYAQVQLLMALHKPIIFLDAAADAL